MARGRPRTFTPEDVLPHALDTFLRHGYAGASVDALAESMGLAKPSLYAAFGTKRELFQRVLEERIKTLSLRYRTAFARGDTLESALRELFLEAVEVYVDEQPGCVIACVAIAEAVVDPPLAEFTRAFFERSDKGLTSLISRFAADEATALGRLANSVIHDIALRARVGETKAKLRTFARESAVMLARTAPRSSSTPGAGGEP